MKTFPLVLLAITSSAYAALLLGTANSFFDSAFCRTYKCSLSSREPLGAGIVDFRYTLAPERAARTNDIPEAAPRCPSSG